jgi:hypothetical protein
LTPTSRFSARRRIRIPIKTSTNATGATHNHANQYGSSILIMASS